MRPLVLFGVGLLILSTSAGAQQPAAPPQAPPTGAQAAPAAAPPDRAKISYALGMDNDRAELHVDFRGGAGLHQRQVLVAACAPGPRWE